MTQLKIGLTLTSGGARGAYQAGVLLAIAEICKTQKIPFQILTGVSAGSINAAFLAARAQDFQKAAYNLYKLWESVTPQDVFLTDTKTLTRIGFNWITDLSLGGWIGSGRGRSLLMTSPLRNFLEAHIDMGSVLTNLRSGILHGLAVTATNYRTGTAITFFDGHPSLEPWFRTMRISRRTRLTIEHLMASSAIPVFFPAVYLEGSFYGDGCIRMNTPLSPAIHLGADKILAVGVRYFRPTVDRDHFTDLSRQSLRLDQPHVADVVGVLLDAMFLDGLEADAERVERINKTIQMIPKDETTKHLQKLKHIPVFILRPSEDLGTLALEELRRFPYAIRHFLRGLGASNHSGWDLLSYLAFDSSYTRRLLDLGYQDAIHQRSRLVEFLNDEKLSVTKK